MKRLRVPPYVGGARPRLPRPVAVKVSDLRCHGSGLSLASMTPQSGVPPTRSWHSLMLVVSVVCVLTVGGCACSAAPSGPAGRSSVLGHRGSGPGVGENTLRSVRAAVDAGADGVEVDVRMTADRRLVLWHDRLLPDGRQVERVSYASLPPGVEDAAPVFAFLRSRGKSLFLHVGGGGLDSPVRPVAAAVGAACGIRGLMVGWSKSAEFRGAVDRACPGTPVGWLPSAHAAAPSSAVVRSRPGGTEMVLVWHTWSVAEVRRVAAAALDAGLVPVWCCKTLPAEVEIPVLILDDLGSL